MKMKLLHRVLPCVAILSTVVFTGSFLSAPVLAHHSAAAYDRTDLIRISGEVTEYIWVNPHTWVYLRVMGPDGEPQEWALEGESVGQYVRMGWTQDQLAVGDTVDAHVWQLKDGSYGAQLGYLIRDDGMTLGEIPETD
jgi:hypothetical protein